MGRAWAAGAGPGDGPMTIDLDSTICEVHGHHKGGAAYGYTRVLGYHPLLATRADTGEVLHARQRTGRAASGRGAERFVNELAGRVRRAGASGPLILRADSGFWSAKVLAACRRHGIRCSVTVGRTKTVTAATCAIPKQAWSDIDYPDGGIAQVAATTLGGDRLRWVTASGLGSTDLLVAKTLRRRLLHLPGRLTRSARRRLLHLPRDWPWATQFLPWCVAYRRAYPSAILSVRERAVPPLYLHHFGYRWAVPITP
jgi:hypothetical protein